MCRPNALGGRRCPSHSDPTFVANRNARRRAQYAKRNQSQQEHTFVNSLEHPLFSAPFQGFSGDELYRPSEEIVEYAELNVVAREHTGHLVNKRYLAGIEVSGVINHQNLDENSYKVFGFREPGSNKKFSPKQATKLSEKELEGYLDPELASLRYFTTIDYKWMNAALYGNSSVLTKDTSGSKKKHFRNFKTREGFNVDYGGGKETHTDKLLVEATELIDESLRKAPGKPRIVYRGLNDENPGLKGASISEWLAQNVSLGQEMVFDGYQSSSLDSAMSTSFAGDNGILFEILTPEGVNVNSVSEWSTESEVILPRKSRYMCVGLHKLESTFEYKDVNVVQLVAIDENGAALNSGNRHTVKKLTVEDFTPGE